MRLNPNTSHIKAQVTMCPVVNCTGQCIEVTQFDMKPLHGHVGQTLNATAYFEVLSQTGTGLC